MKYIESVVNQWEDDYLDQQWPHRVKGGVLQWVSRRRWDVFWTQTFRGCTTVSGAQAKWSHFLADFNSRLLPLASAGQSLVECLWVTEPHQNWASNHVHALLSLRRPISSTIYNAVWRDWKEEAWTRLGKAFILPTKANAYIWYVLKYLTKDAKGIAWDNLPAWNYAKGRRIPSTSRSSTRPPPIAEKTWGIWLPNGQDPATLLEKEMDEL